MLLRELLRSLEYDQSPHYLRTDSSLETDPALSPLLRRAKLAGVHGVYVFRTRSEDKTASARPAVYVAQAATEEKARDIHCRLWNLGRAPFLIVLLPGQVRVYTGFNYSRSDQSEGVVDVISTVLEDVLRRRLSDFSAGSIDAGSLWQLRSRVLASDRRADTRLLSNLRVLSSTLKERGLDPKIAHALVGKYVYIRYLRDRRILSDGWLEEKGIDLSLVLGREATAAGLRKLVSALEDRFNGGVFPLDFDSSNAPQDEDVALVASVFKGDILGPGACVQLSLDFQAYNFEYIPVELLSSIYEQFLHEEERSKRVGAFYTPEPLADYLIMEMDSAHPLRKGMSILDPSCGSGIFLVLAYRRLVEMELAKRPEGRLHYGELLGLLDGFYGVEREQDACYVAEFSLLLTLLDYIEPPELHANSELRFPTLHNRHIFQCDFFDDRSRFWMQNGRFDWVIGNPPWIELGPNTEGEDLARGWIDANKKDRPVGAKRVSEAFSWRVADLLSPDGYAGLVLHAKSLFNHGSVDYRRAFFQQHQVVKVTDFANLRRELFGGRSQAPAVTIVYGKPPQDGQKSAIIHYGPLAVNQVARARTGIWTITVNESEIQAVSADRGESGDANVWKMALWGNFRDARALEQLRRFFPFTLAQLCDNRKWLQPAEGAQLRQREGSSEDLEEASYLEGRYVLNTRKLNQSRCMYSIPNVALDIIPEKL